MWARYFHNLSTQDERGDLVRGEVILTKTKNWLDKIKVPEMQDVVQLAILWDIHM